MNPLLWLKNPKYFGESFQPDEDQVHVLVVIPTDLPANPELLQLEEAVLYHTLLDTPSSTSARTPTFKASLKQMYQCKMDSYEGSQMVRCMLLINMALPSELVIASHLFRRGNEFICRDLMRFDDIDDVKNGLLLFKPLEHAYDHFQISFIYDKSSDEFRLKIFDPSLRQQCLVENLDKNQHKKLLRGDTLHKQRQDRYSKHPGTGFNILTTFGDIDGQPLIFLSVERPYKRCLNLQARLARKKALEAKWIRPDEGDFDDFWSEGMSLAEKMDFLSAREG